MSKKQIKVGDEICAGGSVMVVAAKISDSPVLRYKYGKDYHFYVQESDGRMSRYLDIEEALIAAAKPVIRAQLAARA